jgi:hypothetical protein
VAELIMRDCGGPVCWCGADALVHSDRDKGQLNSAASDTRVMATLAETLTLAVPFHLAQIITCRLTEAQIRARLDHIVSDLGMYGAALYFMPGPVSKSKHRTAQAFNDLAFGIAAAARQPGGIHYAGVHWETTS